MDLTQLSQVIRNRRSVKPALLSSRPVDLALVERLLDNANWAPTHGLTEPWRFRLFAGDSRQGLANTLQTLYEEHTPAEGYRPEKFEKLGKNPLLAPVVIALGMHRDATGKIPEIEEIAAVACAVQNLHLSASIAGLGGFWSSPPIVYSEGMREFLGLDPGGKCLGLFYLGWPEKGAVLPQSRRGSVSDKITWA
jgi:nitroreductase